MRAKPSSSFNPVKLPQPSTTVGRCYSIIELGSLPDTFRPESDKRIHKILVSFELPEYKAVFNEEKGPEPFVVSEEMTFSTNEKSNFSKFVSAWRNKPFTAAEQDSFDPTVMLGKVGLIQFAVKRKSAYKGKDITEVTNENSVLVIAAIMKKPTAMEAPAPINPPFIWDWEPIVEGKEKFNQEKFDSMPEFIQNKIKTSEEYAMYGPSGSGAPAQAQEDKPVDNTPVAGDDW